MKRPLLSFLTIVAVLLIVVALLVVYPNLTTAPGATAQNPDPTEDTSAASQADAAEDASGTRAVDAGPASDSSVEAVTRAIEEGFAGAQIDLLHELYSSDYVGHLAPSGDRATIDLTDLTEIVDLFTAAVPDLEVDTKYVVADGDIVASRVILRGTFTNEFYDAPPTGEAIELEVNTFHRMNEDGQIAEEWVAYDNAWLSQQLGVALVDQ